MPRILPLSVLPIGFVRVDESGDVMRNSDGLCERCDIGAWRGVVTMSLRRSLPSAV